MQAGFALLTCGLVRKKNAAHLVMLSLSAYVFASIAYYAVGFAFEFGGSAVNAGLWSTPARPVPDRAGPLGLRRRLGVLPDAASLDARSSALALFEVAFMLIAAYILVGAICERITFGAFVLCELFVGGVLYPVFGCWVWGGGWLSQLGSTLHLGRGYVDFAGSSVVHAVGGFSPWRWRSSLVPVSASTDADGKPRPFPAHNIVFVVIGTFILLFGWMGLNAGATLGATDCAGAVAVNTQSRRRRRRGAAAMLFWYFSFGKPDISMACNGLLAGLVAISAAARSWARCRCAHRCAGGTAGVRGRPVQRAGSENR